MVCGGGAAGVANGRRVCPLGQEARIVGRKRQVEEGCHRLEAVPQLWDDFEAVLYARRSAKSGKKPTSRRDAKGSARTTSRKAASSLTSTQERSARVTAV